MSNDRSKDDRAYCYIDHANKKSEIDSVNHYLSRLNRNRRRRAELELHDELEHAIKDPQTA